MTAFTFSILTMTTWRLSSLLANEPGPFSVFKHIRRLAQRLERKNCFFRAFHIHKMVECEWCNSMYIGLGVTVLYAYFNALPTYLLILLPFALSAGTIFAKFVIQTLEAAKEFLEEARRANHRQLAAELAEALDTAANRIEHLGQITNGRAKIDYSLWVKEARTLRDTAQERLQ